MGDEDVVTPDRGLPLLRRGAVVALPQVFAAAHVLHPVVAGAAEDLPELARVDDEVVAGVTEDHVLLVAAHDGIVALAAWRR